MATVLTLVEPVALADVFAARGRCWSVFGAGLGFDRADRWRDEAVAEIVGRKTVGFLQGCDRVWRGCGGARGVAARGGEEKGGRDGDHQQGCAGDCAGHDWNPSFAGCCAGRWCCGTFGELFTPAKTTPRCRAREHNRDRVTPQGKSRANAKPRHVNVRLCVANRLCE